ncbi:hypothetical protein AG4045_006825 [Apium graveolens]|uniref:Polygalacturonase n=1 Tax=Apium graveolens TaxID=4045 RepID=A0A6L5B7S9_APIGR|nr:hypothetical protein AG4045_006825 [Apium graveolens]
MVFLLQAFLDTWNATCESGGTMVIPAADGKFLVNKIELGGPCNGQVTFQLDGIIVAPEGNPYSDCWFTFQGVDNLNIQGSGMFDGNGPSAWEHCPVCAATVGFYGTNNAHIQDITSLNSEGFHFLIDGVDGMTFENINITAPGNSPNTDGINMENANNIQILDSNIGTGDDCVAIGQGSTNINVTGGDSKVQISNVKYIGVTGTSSASCCRSTMQQQHAMPRHIPGEHRSFVDRWRANIFQLCQC